MSKAHIGTYLRTQPTWERYKVAPKPSGCFLCTERNRSSFRYWRLIGNGYPYDAVADRHDMLFPIKHTRAWWRLSPLAWLELIRILRAYSRCDQYDCVTWNFPAAQSVPGHVHLHLLRWKRHDH